MKDDIDETTFCFGHPSDAHLHAPLGEDLSASPETDEAPPALDRSPDTFLRACTARSQHSSS